MPTGVGLRYGQSVVWLEAFLGGLGCSDFRPLAGTRPSRYAWHTGICLGVALRAESPACPFAGFTFLTASPLHSSRHILVQDSLTCFPSPTTMTSSA